MMHVLARYTLALIVLILFLYVFASCTPEAVTAWTPIATQVLIVGAGCFATYWKVMSDRDMARRRRREPTGVPPKEKSC